MIWGPLSALANGPLAWRGFAVAAIAMAAVAQLAMPVRLPAADPINATPAAGVRRAAPPPHPAGLYSAIAEHPLFSPSRQPYVPPKASAPAAVAEHSVLRDYQLLGIVVEGDTRIALLKPPDGHQTIHAVPGQTIAGWKLRQITPQLVEFENGTASLALHFSTPRWPHP